MHVLVALPVMLCMCTCMYMCIVQVEVHGAGVESVSAGVKDQSEEMDELTRALQSYEDEAGQQVKSEEPEE